EIADISQPKPIIINAIFHPIPLSKTKINVYRANKLTGIAIPYDTKCNFLFFSLSIYSHLTNFQFVSATILPHFFLSVNTHYFLLADDNSKILIFLYYIGQPVDLFHSPHHIQLNIRHKNSRMIFFSRKPSGYVL